MRYLSTPRVSEKISTLPAHLKGELSVLFNRIAAARTIGDIQPHMQRLSTKDDAESIYMLRAGNELRVFATIGDDTTGQYILLVDVAGHTPKHQLTPVANRDPRMNAKLNPNLNTRINPIYNTVLNPIYNTRINPIYNTSLNPIYNTRINPIYNTGLNPVYNTLINPVYNTKLNPSYNARLNPTVNRDSESLVVYDRQLSPTGFMVIANDVVALLFGFSNVRTGLAVTTPLGGYSIFDADNAYVGYLVPDAQGGYLHFDTSGKWLGNVV